jgi:hypothetical protein
MFQAYQYHKCETVCRKFRNVHNKNKKSYKTRNSSNLHLPSFNLTIFRTGSQYFGIKVYNGLPDNIKQRAKSKIQFKKHCHSSSIYIHFMTWMNFVNIGMQILVNNFISIITLNNLSMLLKRFLHLNSLYSLDKYFNDITN